MRHTIAPHLLRVILTLPSSGLEAMGVHGTPQKELTVPARDERPPVTLVSRAVAAWAEWSIEQEPLPHMLGGAKWVDDAMWWDGVLCQR